MKVWVLSVTLSTDHSSDVLKAFRTRPRAQAEMIAELGKLTLDRAIEPGTLSQVHTMLDVIPEDEGFVFDALLPEGALMGWIAPVEVEE